MRQYTLLLVAMIVALIVAGSASAVEPAHAQPAHEPASASHAAGDAGHSESSKDHGTHGPSYGLLTVDGMTALWTVLVFVALLIILRTAAWKPIQQTLQQREQFISDSLATAKRERQEAERLLADYKARLEKAHQEAMAIVDEGRRDAEEVRKRVHGEAKTEADAIVARARRDIELARDDAVKQLHDQTIMLATAVAGKLIRRELSAADHQALLNEALTELGRLN